MGIRRWLLVATVVVGAALITFAVVSRGAPPSPTPRQAAPSLGASSTATPIETWRPAVRVNWKRYTPQARTRIDTHGQRHDCDALADQLDAAWHKDRALAAYIEAWFSHSGLCHDAYHQKKE